MRKIILSIPFITGFMLLSDLVFTNIGGGPAGLTGAPSEGTCLNCHSGSALNSGPGSVSISLAGGATTYVPGNTYAVTVTVTEAAKTKFGFQATVLNGSNIFTGLMNTSSSAGRVGLSSQNGRSYANHNSSSAVSATSGSNSWTFNWVAPAAGTGTVRFYASGNATNANSGSGGDKIYTTSLAITESVASQPPVITNTTGNSVGCTGDVIVLTKTSGGTVTWYRNGISTGISGNTYNATTTGSYYAVSGSDSSNRISLNFNAAPSIPTITAPSTGVCAGSSLILTSSSTTNNQWFLGGNPIVGQTNPTYSATAAGNYTVKVTNSFNCSSTSAVYTVFANPTVTTNFGINRITQCLNNNLFVFSDSSNSGMGNPGTYEWTFGDGGTSSIFSPTHSYSAARSYNVKLKVTNPAGCKDSTTKTVQVIPNANASLGVQFTLSFCQGDSAAIFLNQGHSTIIGWLRNGAPITNTRDTLWAKSAGEYKAIVSNGSCVDTSLGVQINILASSPKPVITRVGNALNSSYPSNNQWYLNGNLIPGATNSTFNPIQSGSYTVRYTNTSGCVSFSDPFIITSAMNLTKEILNVFPNPNNGQFVINWNESVINATYEIADLEGKLLEKGILQSGKATIIDLPKSGIYLLKVNSSVGNSVQKIVCFR